MLRNPFFVYIATFGTAIAIYHLGWSDIYPPLSLDFYLFFAATFIAAALLSSFVSPAIESTSHYQPGLLPKYSGLLIIATFAMEIALAGGIPLLLVMGGAKFYDLEATATHLHAFLLWSVFSTIRFADFLYSKRKLYLIEASLPVIFYALLVYRGPAVICLMTWVFVFVIKHKGMRPKHFAWIGAIAAFVLLVNGLIGDVRSPGQESAGAPSAAFRNSGVPQTYFWSFLYATIPVANLQLSVDKVSRPQGTTAEFLASELLPDTVSKRILPLLSPRIVSDSGNLVSRDMLYSWEQPQVAPGLNTSTIFGRAYGFFGWVGPAIMFIVISGFIIAYVLLILRSPYRVPCLAWLNTMVVFCLINNMVASAAMLPPLLLLLILPPWRNRMHSLNTLTDL